MMQLVGVPGKLGLLAFLPVLVVKESEEERECAAPGIIRTVPVIRLKSRTAQKENVKVRTMSIRNHN